MNMEIKINMLDVKDGDAIFIELTKPEINKRLVMVIDGGKSDFYITKIKPKFEEIISNNGSHTTIIVVCTHFDSDHIGGLIHLVDEYIDIIDEVWVHKTPVILNSYFNSASNILNENTKHIHGYDSFAFVDLFERWGNNERLLLEKKAELIIESIPELKKFVELIPNHKLKEPFGISKPLENDWPEITILGPSIEFYNSLFPTSKLLENFISEESEEILPSKLSCVKTMLKKGGVLPCDLLKKEHETRLTPTNKASIIISIENKGRKYLFTGDAGIDSFKNIPNWGTILKDIYFLKIPHHASDNNLSKELIGLMQPEYAYNSGDKFENPYILKCLETKKKNNVVKSTKSSGDLFL